MNKLKEFWNSDKKGTTIILVTTLVVLPVVSFIVGGVQIIQYYKDVNKMDDREDL